MTYLAKEVLAKRRDFRKDNKIDVRVFFVRGRKGLFLLHSTATCEV